jgi:hypothetical protein
MSADIVIDFRPEGTVQGMHRDEFNLGFLGAQRIERASEIKFNEESQLWDIYFPYRGGWESDFMFRGFETYNGARDFEVAYINACRLAGYPPVSPKGYSLAAKARVLGAF